MGLKGKSNKPYSSFFRQNYAILERTKEGAAAELYKIIKYGKFLAKTIIQQQSTCLKTHFQLILGTRKIGFRVPVPPLIGTTFEYEYTVHYFTTDWKKICPND